MFLSTRQEINGRQLKEICSHQTVTGMNYKDLNYIIDFHSKLRLQRFQLFLQN